MKHIRERYASLGDGFGETSDCVVRALAIAADIRYIDAHTKFRKHGRISRRGTPIRVSMRLYQAEYPNAIYRNHRMEITIARFARLYPIGNFAVYIKGHALAVCDGIVHNWKPSSRSHVQWSYQLTQEVL